MERIITATLLGLLAGVPLAHPATQYLVGTGGSNLYPYATWATAASNIQTAVNAAAPGDTVLVTNGLYTNANAGDITVVTITNAINLFGVGADKVTISGAGTRRVLAISSTGAVVQGFTITRGYRNSTTDGGGGILMTGGTVRACIISNNVSGTSRRGYGGGVYMVGGTVEDCEFVSNSVSGSDMNAYGAAVYADAGALIQRCRIHHNTLSASISPTAGAVYLVNTCELRNCLVYQNSAGGESTPGPAGVLNARTPLTAGVYSGGAGNRILFCTIAGNVIQSGTGAGLYLAAGAATNTIVFFNSTEFGRDYRGLQQNVYKAAAATFSYGCTDPAVPGTNNLTADPLFADWANGDFRLLPGSPCLDAATTLSDVAADINGTARTADGNGDGTGAPDMGALEADAASAGAFRCGFAAPTNEGVGGVTAAFTAFAAGPDTNNLAWFWDFENDGVNDATGPAASHAYAPGLYHVRLTVSNATAGVSLVKSNEVRVAPEVLYVATNGSHSFPFASPETAATNLQPAIDAAFATASAASRVLVSNGVYRLAREVVVDKSIVLRGVGGASTTILTGQGVSGRRVLSLFAGAGAAVVDGFTLTGGNLPTLQHGAGLNQWTGSVQNCVISNNLNSGRQCKAGGALIWGGTLSGCSILGNTAAGGDGGGLGGGLYAYGGLVERCLVASNQATASSSSANGGGVLLDNTAVLRNCVVAGNTIGGNTDTTKIRGGGVYCNAAGARVENCTIADNSASVGNSAGLYLNNGSLTNTILWRNYLAAADPDSLDNHRNYEFAKTNVGYCDSYPLPPGTNNISGDPQFADRAAGNFRLQINSPALDAGTNLAAVTNDYDGAARPRDGNGDSSAMADIGAFELDPASLPLTCGFSASPYQGVNGIDAVFTATVSGPGAASACYFWDFTADGSFEAVGADMAVVTNHYGIGSWSVNLAVSNAYGTVTNCLKAAYIQVASDVAFVSTNGAHIAPFETWEKASTNLQLAVNAVASGGRVCVSNGVYTVNQTVSLARPVTVGSVNGATVTVVRLATGVYTRVFSVTDAGATLEGFTIRGGSINDNINYGAGLDLENGTVAGCIITSNTVNQRTARGGGVYMANGLLRDCTVAGNSANGQDGNGLGGGLYAVGGLIDRCVIASNRASALTSAARGGGAYLAGAATIRNGLLFGNTLGNTNPALTQGAGVYCGAAGAQMLNGTIADNTADTGTCAGVYVSDGGLTNTIIWRNTLSGADPDSLDNHRNYEFAKTNVGFCDSYPLPPGTNNISGDPLFVASGAGQYRLRSDSPCRRIGLVLPGMAAETDLDGRPRTVLNGVDLGCYQNAAPAGALIILQ